MGCGTEVGSNGPGHMTKMATMAIYVTFSGILGLVEVRCHQQIR